MASLSLYEWVVIDADNARGSNWQPLADATTVFCYLSVGEAMGGRAQTNKQWIIGENPGWKSSVMDVSAEGWKDALVTDAQRLKTSGCEGLFLDTLDSYQLAFEQAEWPKAEAGLAEIVLALKTAEPELAIMLNRGFEIFERVAPAVVGVTAESLFEGWDSAGQRYRPVPADEYQWLNEKLQQVSQAGKEVVVIDYLPVSAEAPRRQRLAQRIIELGYTPWVTDVSLTHLGVGTFSHHPRELALLYHANGGDFAGHDAHILLGAISDYYGLIVRPFDVSAGLPALIQNHHAGVLTWFDGEDLPNSGITSEQWQAFLVDAFDARIPVAMFGNLPAGSNEVLQRMGTARVASSRQNRAELVSSSPGFGDFEAPAPQREYVISPIGNRAEHNTPWVTMMLDGEEVAPVLTGPWGGYAQHPYLLQSGFSGQRRWLVDPFAFLQQALQISPAPIPDTTTENGRRILLSHVDGDGFPSRAELPNTPFSAQVLLDQVFKPIDLPHTVSIIEGEIAETGLYPELSEVLEPLAREIFALDNVELASHSFSHPFFWSRLKNIDPSKTLYGFGLPIKNYTINMRREVAGSIAYIDDKLAPPGKRTEVFLWTGDAIPGGDTIAITKEINVVNLNGGNTQIRAAQPSFANVSAQSRWTEYGWQIYAPIMNENVYTNDWTGPFHGFRRVIETFERTDAPRRLKPLSIYYHFYSGTKPGALNALLDIYDYVLEQPRTAMYISEFSRRVESYHNAQISKSADNTWHINQMGALRTLRLPPALKGVPDLQASTGIAGYSQGIDGRYVHLVGTDATLVLSKLAQLPAQPPRLVSANAIIHAWQFRPEGKAVDLQLVGYEPVELKVDAPAPCTLVTGHGKTISPSRGADGIQELNCKAKIPGRRLCAARASDLARTSQTTPPNN